MSRNRYKSKLQRPHVNNIDQNRPPSKNLSLKWVKDNKKWLFSGIGVLVISYIISWLNYMLFNQNGKPNIVNNTNITNVTKIDTFNKKKYISLLVLSNNGGPPILKFIIGGYTSWKFHSDGTYIATRKPPYGPIEVNNGKWDMKYNGKELHLRDDYYPNEMFTLTDFEISATSMSYTYCVNKEKIVKIILAHPKP